MKTSFKYGVSAIAFLAAISLAQAQTSERQGGGASGSEHSAVGRGGESGHSAQGERSQGGVASQAEHSGGSSSQHQGRSAEESGSPRTQSGHQSRSANQREEHREQSAEHNRNQEHGQQAEHSRGESQAAQDREGGRTGQLERNGEEGKGERSARTERENRGAQGEETRGRETGMGGARGNETAGRAGAGGSRFASISREQRTRIYGILVRDTAIHRYHRADVDFPVRVGTRIPNTVEFYDPPAQIVQIDPVFQGYKIVVLDDVILVVDPATREIVDVIRA